MRDDHGNKLLGIVMEHGDDHIVMDFNHPLAGRSLNFSGKVISSRVATQDEIDKLTGGGCGCGSSCGCDGEGDGHKHGDDDCGVCGNGPEDQGQAKGNCNCS
jgi:FKBP-type peptidyl-prolyl cis-trans isomerase SlyD